MTRRTECCRVRRGLRTSSHKRIASLIREKMLSRSAGSWNWPIHCVAWNIGILMRTDHGHADVPFCGLRFIHACDAPARMTGHRLKRFVVQVAPNRVYSGSAVALLLAPARRGPRGQPILSRPASSNRRRGLRSAVYRMPRSLVLAALLALPALIHAAYTQTERQLQPVADSGATLVSTSALLYASLPDAPGESISADPQGSSPPSRPRRKRPRPTILSRPPASWASSPISDPSAPASSSLPRP